MADVIGSGVARRLIDSDGDPLDNSNGQLKTVALNPLVPAEYNYISLSYNSDGNLQTVVYKTDGSGGTTVATLTLVYVDGNLSTITRS